MRIPPSLVFLLIGTSVHARSILHFTSTSGFDHNTRGVSHTMFQTIADELGLTVVDDDPGNSFSDPFTLAQYDVIVFSNTSGNDILNAQQRANFEQWVANGGHVLGIHAASDTYRHSTANGSNTGTWDFYAELIGGSVQENPHHVDGTPQYGMQHIGTHASTAGLPDPWVKNEEYYYWENGYYGPDNTEVLRVEQTVGPNGLVNSYDAPRPMSWYRMLPNGSRVFYTALGHDLSNFTSDMLFRTHIKDALVWLLEGWAGVAPIDGTQALRIYPNPATDVLHISADAPLFGQPILITDAMGRVVKTATIMAERTTLPVQELANGNYVVRTLGASVPAQIMR